MVSFTRNQSLAMLGLDLVLGQDVLLHPHVQLGGGCASAPPPVAVAVSFHTPRLGSVDSGSSMVAMPYSSVVTVFLKILMALASWISMVASVVTGFSSESSATSRTCIVWPGL